QARRRREDTTLQIRKNKREEGLAKRRAFQRDVAPVLAPKPDAGNPAAPERPTVADMPRLLNEIQSQDPAVVVAATRGWRKLLSVEPQPPVDAVLATGVVAVLARLLAHHAMPELQFEAAWALTNVASTDKTQAVVDAGVVPAMVQLMQSPNGDVREQCIWCLGNIAGDSTESRDAVLAAGRAAGALEPLIANLQNPATTSLLRNATWSLSNLCRGTPKPDVARLAPAIPVLVGLLRSDDVDTLMDACWALSYLSDGDEARIQCVVDHGAAAALSPLLGHASHKVVTPALRTLGNVVTGNDAQTQAALDAGVLAHVAALLASPRKAIRKETCWLVSNVAAGTPPQIAAVASDAALLKLVVHQLDAGDWDVKKEATWVVSNVLSGGHKNHVLALVEHGVIKPLCALLATAEAKIVTVALDALEAILKVGHFGGVPAANLVDEADGVEKLENLQHHENARVYEKAVGIIETYFGAEDDEAPDVAPDIAGDGAAFSFG
ncbi:hypothetical protein AURANDRAFT_1526, partial [Aureococcus anophagefferens]